MAKPKCHEQKHKVTDFGKDVKEFDGWIVEMETDANQGVEEVGKGLGHLQEEKDQLENKLNAVNEKMEVSEGHRQKLIEIVADCEEMKLLPSETKASVFMRKNLRQSMADTKQEVAKAVEFVKTISVTPVEGEQKVEEKVEVIFSILFYLSSTRSYFYLDYCFSTGTSRRF